MGTKLAPNYTNLFKGNFEGKFVYTYKDKSACWKIFSDDIFLLWTLGRDKLTEFIQFLNMCPPNNQIYHRDFRHTSMFSPYTGNQIR